MEEHIYFGNCSSSNNNNSNNNSNNDNYNNDNYNNNKDDNNNNGSNSDLTTTVDGRMLDFSNQELYPGTNLCDVPNPESLGNILDDLLQDMHGSTGTDTFQQPDQDMSRTYDYIRLYADMLSPPNEEKSSENDDFSQVVECKKNKRVKTERGDNREAVRKYREKLKAHEASLQDEIKKLRAINQQLLKKLEGESAMQDEILWLKCLLVDIRGRIEGETRSFRYCKPSHTRFCGYDRITQCNGNYGISSTIKQSTPVIHGQVINDNDSRKLNSTTNVGSEPKNVASTYHKH